MEKALFSPKYASLLAWLRSGREARGWTIRELAVVLGESHAVIGKIEIGERRLDVYEFMQYCQALELDPLYGIKYLE